MFTKRSLLGFVALASLSVGCTQALDFESTKKGGTDCASFAPHVTFCDDFDHGHLLATWNEVEEVNGTAAVDEAASRTKPASLSATSVGLTAHGGFVRAVAKQAFSEFGNKPITIRASFDMMVERFDPTAGAQMAAFTILYGPLDHQNELFLYLNSTGAELTWQISEKARGLSIYQDLGPFKDPLNGAWTAFELEFTIRDPVGVGNVISARLNGQNRLVARDLQIPLRGEFPRVELGIGWVNTTQDTQPWSIRYDNFVLDVIPL